MTIAELRAKLDEHPSDMEVCVIYDAEETWPRDVNFVWTEKRTTGVLLPNSITRTVIVLSP